MKPIICITCDRRNQGPTPKNTTKIRPARPEVFIKEAHSRVPIYEKNLDNIIGMVHIKDLVNYQNSKSIGLAVRPLKSTHNLNILEIVSDINFRDTLNIKNGDILEFEL